ncbi:MAG: CinA family protein [Candidatus Sigynarchaeota archaeon]
MKHVDAPIAELLVAAKTVIETLAGKECMLGISESVTGGTIASYLTRIDGCSNILFASQVLYSSLGKSSFCELPMKKIVEQGTVSKEIISEMLDCMARRFFKALEDPDATRLVIAPRHFVSLATCGVAGDPIEDLPRGTVLEGISLYRDGKCIENEIRHMQLEGNRWTIISGATRAALSLILEKASMLSIK